MDSTCLRLLQFLLRFCLFAAFTLLATFAQEKNKLATPASHDGSIFGCVRDSSDGNLLVGVNVLLLPTNSGVATDLNGEFRFNKLAEGTYSIRVSYIGYYPTQRNGIPVVPGNTTQIDLNLLSPDNPIPLRLSPDLLEPELARQHGRFWRPTDGLNDQGILSLAFGSNGRAYAGTDAGAVFRSSDRGATWRRASGSLTHDEVTSLAVDTQGNIFAGTSYRGGGLRRIDDDPIGVFRSTDDGASWKLVFSSVWVYSIQAQRNGHLYVCSNKAGLVSEVLRSSDEGNTWINLAKNLPALVNHMALDSNGSILVTPFREGIYSLHHDDTTWENIHCGARDTIITGLVLHPSGMLLAATDVCGVLCTHDGGRTWMPTNAGLSDLQIYLLTINLKGHVFALTDSGLFGSTDSCQTWRLLSRELTARAIRCLAIDDLGFLYAGTAGFGVFRSALSTY